MNVQLENEQITKLLNDWYQSMLKQQLVKAKQLKEYIDSEINNVKENQNLLLGVPPHAHQLKNLHYPQVSKNVILSKKLARKDDIFYESFNS
ncbi:hypothetical protein PDN20_31560, partial [Bacillus cereus]|nr:hypothetical protein [Bacillus cereus]